MFCFAFFELGLGFVWFFTLGKGDIFPNFKESLNFISQLPFEPDHHLFHDEVSKIRRSSFD